MIQICSIILIMIKIQMIQLCSTILIMLKWFKYALWYCYHNIWIYKCQVDHLHWGVLKSLHLKLIKKKGHNWNNSSRLCFPWFPEAPKLNHNELNKSVYHVFLKDGLVKLTIHYLIIYKCNILKWSKCSNNAT